MRSTYGLILFLVITLLSAAAQADICSYPERGTLAVLRGNKEITRFQVGLATSPDTYRRGLMGCQNLPQGTGLFFIYRKGDRRIFWMKNTPLDLAIIFASPDGIIRAIERGYPRSNRRIRSPDHIQFVLEINFSEAEPLQIGDHMILRRHPE